jgi:hypothetical protein
MSKLAKCVAAGLAVVAMHGAQAGTITDTYIGASAPNNADVIGRSDYYDITSATITRVDSVLKVVISTVFSGKAGTPTSGTTPVGYGDLFLSNVWTPAGTDAGHVTDNMDNGTLWKYGIALTDAARVLNTTATTALYKLNGTINDYNIKSSNTVMTNAGLGGDIYRTNQSDVVNTAGQVTKMANTGTMSLATNTVTFSIDIAGTDMMNWNSFAMHWGETCQNDVIEGITSVGSVPEPASIALLGLGMAGLIAARRRKAA